MPPQISDEEMESDGGPDEVPAREKPATTAEEDDVEGEGEDEDEDDDDEEEGEEYKVEAILKHNFDKDGSVRYQIKWEGYDKKADLTWEPIENLDNAQQALDEYHKKIGGAPEPKSAKKRGKRSAEDSPVVNGAAKKRQRKSDAHGATATDKKDNGLPDGSWEAAVTRVTSILQDSNRAAKGDKADTERELLGLVEWTDGRKSQHTMSTLRRKIPQKLLDYYEQHLVFHGADDVKDEALKGEPDD